MLVDTSPFVWRLFRLRLNPIPVGVQHIVFENHKKMDNTQDPKGATLKGPKDGQ
jgi:hypothetical protein